MTLVNRIIGLIGLAAVLTGGYMFVRWRLDEVMYERRLKSLSKRYEALQERYRTAVRKTAVTELLVEEGALAVVIRTIEGRLQTIATPFNPEREIYIDYVIADGRIWIRRVFDSATPPERALVIDPEWSTVDWSAPGSVHGKAVYRRLEPGRWVVTVTGNGSLGLARLADGQKTGMVRAPEIGEFE